MSKNNPERAQLPPTIRAHCHMLGWEVLPCYPHTKAKEQLWRVEIIDGSPRYKRIFFIDGTNWFVWRAAFKRGCAKPDEADIKLSVD